MDHDAIMTALLDLSRDVGAIKGVVGEIKGEVKAGRQETKRVADYQQEQNNHVADLCLRVDNLEAVRDQEQGNDQARSGMWETAGKVLPMLIAAGALVASAWAVWG